MSRCVGVIITVCAGGFLAACGAAGFGEEQGTGTIVDLTVSCEPCEG